MPRPFDENRDCQKCKRSISDSENHLMRCASCRNRWHHLCHDPPLAKAQVAMLNHNANELYLKLERERRQYATPAEKVGTAYAWRCSVCTNRPAVTIDLTESDDEQSDVKLEQGRDMKTNAKADVQTAMPAGSPATPALAASSVTACGARNMMASSDLKGKGKAVAYETQPIPETRGESSGSRPPGAASTLESTRTVSSGDLNTVITTTPSDPLVMSTLYEPQGSAAQESSVEQSFVRPIARLPNRAIPQPIIPTNLSVIDILQARTAQTAPKPSVFAEDTMNEVIELASSDEDEGFLASLPNAGFKRTHHVKTEEVLVDLSEPPRIIAPIPRSRLEALAAEEGIVRTPSADVPMDPPRTPTPGRTPSRHRILSAAKAARKSVTPQPPSSPPPIDFASMLGTSKATSNKSKDTQTTDTSARATPAPTSSSPTDRSQIVDVYQAQIIDDHDSDKEELHQWDLPPYPKPAWLNRKWPPHPLLEGTQPPADWNQPPVGRKVPRKGQANRLLVQPKIEIMTLPEDYTIRRKPFKCGLIQVAEDWPLPDSFPETNSPEL